MPDTIDVFGTEFDITTYQRGTKGIWNADVWNTAFEYWDSRISTEGAQIMANHQESICSIFWDNWHN
jgi:hypothetical protein